MKTKDLLKKVRKIEIKTRRLSNNIFGGEYHSAFKGRGMTFSEVRSYQYGDDVRTIDWNVTARYNEPFIKVFEEVGFIFLFAPLHHQSMKYVMPARQRIGQKTIFNLLGPHTNPCGARRQVIGVYDSKLLKTFSTV